jgi:hypothetical protein
LLGTAGGEEVTLAVGETYTGTMILTLTNTNEITLSGSFTDPNAGPNEYSFVDMAPPTKSFSVVGFLNGNAIDADQANFQNIDVTYTPFSTALIGDHNGDGMVDAMGTTIGLRASASRTSAAGRVRRCRSRRCCLSPASRH